MAEGSSSTDDTVTDGFKDIAKRFNLDSMMVEAPGRRRFQKVHLWTPSKDGKVTIESYKANEHGPEQAGKCPKLPTDHELVPAKHTTEFLEVGLVYGDDPLKNMPKGASESRARCAQKKNKEAQRRPDSMMRVFTPVTDFIRYQNKMYIGCHPENGRLNHRLGSGDCVFYYPEFYEGIAEGNSQREIDRLIRMKTREAAARIKTFEEPNTAVIAPDQLSKSLTAHPVVEEAQPGLKYGLDTRAEGITCFMDFDEELAYEKAEILSQELKSNYLNMKPCVMLIKQVHGILCKSSLSSSGSAEGDGKGLFGDKLMVSSFGFFMEAVHIKMVGQDSDGDGNYDETVLSSEINNALEMTEIFTRHAKNFGTPGDTITFTKSGGNVGEGATGNTDGDGDVEGQG